MASHGKRMRLEEMEDDGGETPSRDDQEEDGFDPMAFYKQQQQAMLLQATQHVEQTRQEITRVQEIAEQEATGVRRPRRSAATAATMALSYMTNNDSAMDTRIFGQDKAEEQEYEKDREDVEDEEAGEDVVFQTPIAPAPRAKPKTPARAAGTGGRRGRPPGSARAGGSRPRAKGRAKRDWGEDGDEEYEEVPKKGGQRGRRPAMPTAEDENSLYFIVRTGRASLQQTVDDWIEEYKVDRDGALLKLMQYFISASGCKGKITSEMQVTLEHADIIRRMTEEFDEESGEYPLTTPGQYWKKFKGNFCEFVQLLVKQCQYSIIYDQYLMDNVISLLTQLSDSQVRAFRHTSTMAALKLMTALVDVALTVSINLDNTARQYDSERAKSKDKRAADRLEVLMTKRQELEENMDEIKNMLTYMFKSVFVHRYRDTLPEIRSICMQEIGTWMKKFHQNFLDDSYLKYIGWTLHDKVGDVRLKCLQSLEPLYASEELKGKLELFTSKFKDRIVSMTLDKEFDVAVEAVKLVISILKFHQEILSDKDCEHVYELVYSSHRAVAQAAGEFLNERLFLPDEEAVRDLRTKRGKKRLPNTPLIRDLVQFFIESELHEHGSYLVDSLIESNPMMKDWECMTDLLIEEPGPMEEGLDDRQETSLIEIMVCCIRQSATGDPPVGRGSSRKVLSARETKQIQDDKIALTSHFITTLPQLLHKYLPDPEKMANLLIIPQYFDLEIYTTSRQEKALESLLRLVQEVVDKHSDTDVLETAAQTLEKLCDDQFPIFSRCETNRSRLLDMVSNRYRESLDEYTNLLTGDEEPDQDEVYALVSSLKKVSIFYNCHDMGHWNIWSGLLDIVIKSRDCLLDKQPLWVPEEAVKYCLLGCYFGLLWDKNSLADNLGGSTTHESIQDLKERLGKFMQVSKEMMGLEGAGAQLKEEAFISICDLLIVFGHCGEASGQTPMKPLAFKPDEGMGVLLNIFIQDHVFIEDEDEDIDDHQKIEELHKRRNFLACYCKLVVYNVLPTKSAADVLKHYVTFYNDYGDIIKATLGKARENNKTNCAKTMIQSLIYKFNELQQEAGGIDRGSEEFHAIKELAKRFALSFGLDALKNRDAVASLHREGILVAVNPLENPEDPAGAPPNLAFLEILTEFTGKLLKQDKKVVLGYLDKRVAGGVANSRSDDWAPLNMYRNSLVHGEGDEGRSGAGHQPKRQYNRKRRRSGSDDDDDPDDEDFRM